MKVSLEKNGIIIARNVNVVFIGRRFEFRLPTVPPVEPNQPSDKFKFVYHDGTKQEIVVVTSFNVMSTVEGAPDIQIVEGYIN